MKDNSGPAFPTLDCFVDPDGKNPVYAHDFGMTKRELIAMHVMAEMMGAHDADGNWTAQGCELEAARSAKTAANALLAELAKE